MNSKWPDTAWYVYTLENITTYALEGSGIYAIGTKTEWVYIGEADNVQERLLEHYNGWSDQSGCISQYNPDRFSYVPHPPENRTDRESELIAEHNPFCNQD